VNTDIGLFYEKKIDAKKPDVYAANTDSLLLIFANN